MIRYLHPLALVSAFVTGTILSICNVDAQITPQQLQDINNTITAAERICLVGNRITLNLDANGGLTISKLLPEGKAVVTFQYADAKGGQFFKDPQVQALVEGQILECMQKQWIAVLHAPPSGPTTQRYDLPALVTLDGNGHRLGAMDGISISIISNAAPAIKDKYIVKYKWGGSGGTQHGSQIVIVSLMAKNNAIVQAIKFPLDRSHCYYGGNVETHEGDLTVAPSLITAATLEVTRVEGTQNPC